MRQPMTTTCPRCKSEAHLHSCDEVDVGVGVITGNHVWSCDVCEALFDDDGRFDDESPAEAVDTGARLIREVFAALAASAGVDAPVPGSGSVAFEVADMSVFHEAALRAAGGEPFELPPGLARRKS